MNPAYFAQHVTTDNQQHSILRIQRIQQKSDSFSTARFSQAADTQRIAVCHEFKKFMAAACRVKC